MDRAQYEKFAVVDAQHWWFQARRDIVTFVLESLWSGQNDTRNILDIGTGTGGMVPVLSRWGHLTATEPDPVTMEFTKGRFESLSKSVTFKSGAWEDLELPVGHFDLITAFDVLEHCEDDQKSLKKWRSWLKSDAVLLLTVPAFPCLWGRNDEISHHFRRYTKSTLSHALSETGFEIEKISYINSVMFAPVWISRNIKEPIDKRFAKQKDIMPWDFDLPPAPLNKLLHWLFSSETSILKNGELPWGTSLLAIARVKRGSADSGH